MKNKRPLNARIRTTKARGRFSRSHPLFFSALLLFLFAVPGESRAQVLLESQLEKNEKEKSKTPVNPYLAYKQKRRVEIKELETCSWLVTYRKRVYDLSPLSRKGLERPLEGDMHTILRRVPGAENHLDQITRNNRDARVHTSIATFAIASLLVTRIVQGNSSSKGKSPKYMALNIGSVLLFLRAAYAGFELKQDTKEELVEAVQEFNNVSEDPILPYEGGL